MNNKIEGKRVQINLADNVLKLLDDTKKKLGISRSALISIAINYYVQEGEKSAK